MNHLIVDLNANLNTNPILTLILSGEIALILFILFEKSTSWFNRIIKKIKNRKNTNTIYYPKSLITRWIIED